jgi:hypothetical protein
MAAIRRTYGGRTRRPPFGPDATRGTVMGWRRRPHLPGLSSNRPAQSVPQARQRPAASVQSVTSYQSRPIKIAPQP